MTYTNKQYLTLMKEYFVDAYKNMLASNQEKSMANITFMNRFAAFSYMIELFDFSQFPSIVPDEKFNELSSVLFFRGVEDAEHTANLLCDFNYHYGKGTFADGIYISPISVIAELYTRDPENKMAGTKKENILTLKLDKSTKFCEFPQIVDVKNGLRKLSDGEPKQESMEFCLKSFENQSNYPEIQQKMKDLFDFVESTESEEEKNIFLKTLFNDAGKLAIYLGFDALAVDEDKEIFAVFNRGKIIVPKSEFDRFVGKSKGYDETGSIKRFLDESARDESSEKIPQKC